MAYRVKYTVVRAFPWDARQFDVGAEFCEPDVTSYQLNMLVSAGKLTEERAVIYQRGPGTKQTKAASKKAA